MYYILVYSLETASEKSQTVINDDDDHDEAMVVLGDDACTTELLRQEVLTHDELTLPDETLQFLPESASISHPIVKPLPCPSANTIKKRKIGAHDIQVMQYEVLELEKKKVKLEIENLELRNRKMMLEIEKLTGGYECDNENIFQ